MIQIARDGEILGHVELAQIPDALAQGTVLATDHYWAEGMPEWRLVEELASMPAANQDVVDQAETSTEPVEPTNDKRDWRSDPATAKQVSFLESLGVSITGPITKGEASELIDRYKDSPEAHAYKFAKWEKEQEAERVRRSDFPSFHLKVDIDHACSEIERVKKAILESPKHERRREALEEQIMVVDDPHQAIALEKVVRELEASGVCDTGGLKMELADLKDQLKSLQAIRAKYWRFTFRADWIDGDQECDLVDYGDAINRHHFEHGRFLKVPSLKEVKEIIAELDSGHPGWDQTMPEAFYAFYNARNSDAFLPPNKVR